MNLLEQYKAVIKKNGLFSPKDRLLLAVSGGIDSVVLCELCSQAGYDFVIAHCNFQLRGAESERDEQFVGKLGDKYRVEVLVKRFDTERYAAGERLSIQEAARNLRYEWFRELVESHESLVVSRESGGESQESRVVSRESLVVSHEPLVDNQEDTNNNESSHRTRLTTLLTAHHADDNAETLLMNFFRGTGLHGLTGIPVSANHIRRPLLEFSKEEIVAFAKENKLDFVEDSSNESSKYTRNFFRNELIPAISKVYPQVKENLQDNISRFKEIEKLYQFSIGELKKKVCRQKGNDIQIPARQLLSYNSRALIYEIISPFGFNEKQVDEVLKLADSESGKFITSPANTYRIIKHRNLFIISPVNTGTSENIIIEKENTVIAFPAGNLQFENTRITDLDHKGLNKKHSRVKQVLPTDNNIAWLDAKELSFPLLLRKWKTGDYFYPIGMNKKKKKVSRFLTNLKLSPVQKENVWVLESAQRIIWVVGLRIDERCKVTLKTNEVLQISFTS